MKGLVTLIVGETGRASGSRAVGRRAPSRGAATGVGAAPVPDAGQAAPALAAGGQWSCQWGAEGPGPVGHGTEPGEGEPDLSLALSPQDARLVASGKLAPSVAFMQGRLKTSGENALLLSVLAWTATPAFAEAREKLDLS